MHLAEPLVPQPESSSELAPEVQMSEVQRADGLDQWGCIFFWEPLGCLGLLHFDVPVGGASALQLCAAGKLLFRGPYLEEGAACTSGTWGTFFPVLPDARPAEQLRVHLCVSATQLLWLTVHCFCV